MASTGFVESRRPIEGHLGTHRNHGIYSSKIKVPLAADISNKPTAFNSVGMPYTEANGSKNLPGRWKGKVRPPRTPRIRYRLRAQAHPRHPSPLISAQQVMTRWPHTGEFFRKLEYAPAAYDDTSKRDKLKKTGFGSTGKLNRDDLSSTIEVGRYRAQLEIELRGANAATLAQQATLGIAERGRTRPATAPTIGMTTVMRSFKSEFDRVNYVPEFTTKNPPGMGALKGERFLGSLRPMSADHGEGCVGSNVLQSPAHAVGNFAASMQSKYARPSTSGRSFLVPIGV